MEVFNSMRLWFGLYTNALSEKKSIALVDGERCVFYGTITLLSSYGFIWG